MMKLILGEKTVEYIMLQTGIVSIFWVFVLIAVCVDLRAGIRASKKIGDFKTNSHGIRRTGRKLLEYWSILAMSLLIDFGLLTLTIISDQIPILLIFRIPVVSIFIFVSIIVTEFLSVKENIEIRKGNTIIPKKTISLLAEMVEKVGETDNKINAKTVSEIMNVLIKKKDEQI